MLETRSRWALCIMLLAGTSINYLDRQTLSLTAPMMRDELGLDNARLGLLFSFFYYSYTFAQFAVGGWLDRAHLRWAYGGAVLAWSMVGLLTSFSIGFWSMAAFRILLGITESPNWPGALKIVQRALPERERPLGNGIFTSGQSIGALTAPAIILTVAAWAGWRSAFVAVGLIGVVWFAVWVWFSRRPEFAPVWQPAIASTRPVSEGYKEVIRSPKFWCVLAITCTVNPTLYFNVNWLPTYFNQERGMAAGSSEMRWILTLIFLGLDLGYLTFGFAAMRLPRIAIFSVATALVSVAALVPWADRNQMVALLVVSNFGIGMCMSMFLTLTQEVSKTAVSTAMGMLGGMGSLAGAVLMWLVGIVTQRTHSFSGPFIAIACAMMIAWTAGLISTRLSARAS